MVDAAFNADGALRSPAARSTGARPVIIRAILILGCAYAFNAMDRQIFPALLGPIRKEYSLTLAEGGLLANAFTVTVVIFGAASGWVMSRYSRKATLISGLLAYSIFTFITPFASNFTEVAIYRAMTGAGEALQIAASFAMIGAYFGHRRGTFSGINNAFFGIGAFLGPFLGTRMFVALDSWRMPFYVYGALGIVSALTVYLFVPKSFTDAADEEAPLAGEINDICPDHWLNRNTILCAVAFACVGYAFFAYGALYVTYLRTQLGYSIVDAGTAFGMYGVGTLLAVVGGWLGEKLKRTGLLAALATLTLVSYFLFHNVSSLLAQSALSFGFGAMVSGYLYPRFTAVAQRCVQAHHIGSATALIITPFFLSGLFAGGVFGALVPLIGWSSAATLSVALPGALACLLMLFQNPRRMRGT